VHHDSKDTNVTELILPVTRRKPRGQGPARRGEILAAAKRLFLREGIQHATMRRIAADVGVSSTALYVYFPDKLAILQAIGEAMFEALLVAYAESQLADQPPLARFRAGLRAYIDLALSRPDEYRLTFAAKSTPVCHHIEAATTSFGMLQRNVADLVESGIFIRAEPMVIAEALWAWLHGVVMLMLDQPDHICSPADQLIDTVLDAAINGFRAHEASRQPLTYRC
jgi:AcrR family transcriptional regulator